MYVKSAIGIAALLALTVTGTVAASSAPGTTGGSEGSGAAGGALADYGENPGAADPALVAKALGPVEPSDDDSWNIILAAIARANQDLDQATIDKAMECWSAKSCDTGSGGDLVMGYADGGGDTGERVAVGEPHGGHPASADLPRDRQDHLDRRRLQPGSGGSGQRHPVPGAEWCRLHRRLPRRRHRPRRRCVQAEAAGGSVPVLLGGLRRTAGSGRRPRSRSRSHVGDRRGPVRALGQSFAGVLNTGVGSGEVAMLGGTPGNALTLGWQQCAVAALADGVDLEPAGRRQLDHRRHLLGEHDGARRRCADCSRRTRTSRSWARVRRTGSTPPSRRTTSSADPGRATSTCSPCARTSRRCSATGSTAPAHVQHLVLGGRQLPVPCGGHPRDARLKGDEVPGQVVVPHVMRQVTAADCNPDASHPVARARPWCPTACSPRCSPVEHRASGQHPLRGRATQWVTVGCHRGHASDRAPARERQATAGVAGERNERVGLVTSWCSNCRSCPEQFGAVRALTSVSFDCRGR